MMRIIFLVMLPLAWSYGELNSQGGGAFAYVDASGNRYGGTYGPKERRVVRSTGDVFLQNFGDKIEYSQLFIDTAHQGEDDEFSSFPSLSGLAKSLITNSAGPGFQDQVASIFSSDPGNPNVDLIKHFSDASVPSKKGEFYLSASKSFSSTSNVDGKKMSSRGSETLVNNNGKITHHKVQA